MNRFDIINRIGDKYRVGNTETGEFSYAQALKTVGKDIKDLEEAVRNVNRKHYDLGDSTSEEDLELKGKSKTDFALDLICKCADYCVPAYIKSGLTWLNNQRVLE